MSQYFWANFLTVEIGMIFASLKSQALTHLVWSGVFRSVPGKEPKREELFGKTAMHAAFAPLILAGFLLMAWRGLARAMRQQQREDELKALLDRMSR